MLAEIMYRSGYHLGGRLMGSSEGNPHGYFESYEIEWMNENILEACLPQRASGFLARFQQHIPVRPAHWLAIQRHVLTQKAQPQWLETLHKAKRQEPWCFKDPRFSYSLPVIREHLDNPVYLVVFRSPEDTAVSMQKEYEAQNWKRFVRADRKHFLKVWEAMYRQILDHHSTEGEWVFLHYDEVLDGSAKPRLEAALNAELDWSGVDPALKRSQADSPIANPWLRTYRTLQALSALQADTFKRKINI